MYRAMGESTGNSKQAQGLDKELALIVGGTQAYVSGSALNILTGPSTLLQTIYQDDCNAFESVAFSDSTGMIAACDRRLAYVYQPYGREEGALKVVCVARDGDPPS